MAPKKNTDTVAAKEAAKAAEAVVADVSMGAGAEPAAVGDEAKELVEHETDAPAAKGKKLGDKACAFRVQDTTLNVMQTTTGKHLMALSDGGFQYLLAGARGSVGLKAGRYMFEVLLTECKYAPDGKTAGPRPRCYARVGFATEDAPLLLGDGALSVCFDTEGFFSHGRSRSKVAQTQLYQGQVAAVVLNLDPSSPNANTLSLFVDGVRASAPQALPEELRGKALFPAVTFRNMTLQAHFGPEPLRRLPFKCLLLGEALVADSVVLKEAPQKGKHEVMVPVGLPDEGTFDWLDTFLAKNRNYVELSDRAILDWARKSGVQTQGGLTKRSCNDRPELAFNLPDMDDLSLQKVIATVAPLLPRNYVIMEVKNSLLESGRKDLLARFPASDFKKVARVVAGEPPAAFKAIVQSHTLKEKQAKADMEAKKRRVELAREKAAEEAKNKRVAEQKQRLEAAKKARLEREAKKKEGQEEAADKKDGEEAEAEKAAEAEAEKAAEAEEEPAKEVAKEAEEETKMEVDEKEEQVKVELTAEEKQRRFIKHDTPDLMQKDMSLNYMNFTFPKKEEGFDDVVFEWAKAAESDKYLKAWVADRKVTQRVEDLQPSAWFKEKNTAFQKELQAWKRHQLECKDPKKRKAVEEAKRKAEEARKRKAAKEMNQEESKEEAKEETKEEIKEEGKAVEDTQTKKDIDVQEEAKEEEPPKEEVKIDADSLDVFAVDNIDDIGDGQPLYDHFQYEDWSLLSLRFEIHLLVHAFRHDLDDASRQTFHESHLAHYYQLYYKKPLSPKAFGVSKLEEAIAWIKDTVDILSKNGVMEWQISDDAPIDIFVRLTEDHRRERQRRVDMGDDEAQLKFARTATSTTAYAGQSRGSHDAGHQGQYAGPVVGKGTSRQSYSSGSPGAVGQKRPYGAAGNSAAPAQGGYAAKRGSYGIGAAGSQPPPPPPPSGGSSPYGTTVGYGLVPSRAGYGVGPSTAYGASGKQQQQRQGYGSTPYGRR